MQFTTFAVVLAGLFAGPGLALPADTTPAPTPAPPPSDGKGLPSHRNGTAAPQLLYVAQVGRCECSHRLHNAARLPWAQPDLPKAEQTVAKDLSLTCVGTSFGQFFRKKQPACKTREDVMMCVEGDMSLCDCVQEAAKKWEQPREKDSLLYTDIKCELGGKTARVMLGKVAR